MAATLTVPASRGTPPKDLEIRPRQAKAWAESLPLARSVESALRIRDHVSALNRAKVETDDRVQILQNHQAIADVLMEELEDVYARGSIPLPDRGREALAAARDLASALALGYTIAASERAARLIAFGAKKQVPALLLRAAGCLAAVLRASYKAYTPVPDGTWRALHEIYVYADTEGFAAEPADAQTQGTIAATYGESLLLALTDPYRLAPGELDRVLLQVRSAKAPLPLAQARPATPTAAHFLVPCDTDKPPKPALSANDERGGPNWRLLDANPLVDKLRARKTALDKGQVSAATRQALGADAPVLLSKLITLWGDPPRRASRRDPTESTVALCVGLKAVSHYASLGSGIDAREEADRIRRGITIPLLAFPRDEQSRLMPVTEWEVVNQSAGGLKVRRGGALAQPVSVGEIVGVKLAGRARWTIGLLRWITVLEHGALECGIQFLSSGGRPVAVRPTITAAETQAKPALLLDEALPWRGGESLIAAANTFADLRELEIADAGQRFNVRATNLHEKTARYEIFEFTAS